MAYETEACAPANVLDHADSVFNSAIGLSQQVRAIVDHLCGIIPEPVGKQAESAHGSAFSHLRNRANDALASIQEAQAALRRLEGEVGYRDPMPHQGSSARFAS